MLLNQNSPFALVHAFDRFAKAELKPANFDAVRKWGEISNTVSLLAGHPGGIKALGAPNTLEFLFDYLEFADQNLVARRPDHEGVGLEWDGYKAMADQLRLFLDPAAMPHGDSPDTPAVVVFDTDGNIRVEICENRKAAELCTFAFVQESWAGEFDEIPMSDDPLEAIESYFARVESERVHIVPLSQLKVFSAQDYDNLLAANSENVEGEETGPCP